MRCFKILYMHVYPSLCWFKLGSLELTTQYLSHPENIGEVGNSQFKKPYTLAIVSKKTEVFDKKQVENIIIYLRLFSDWGSQAIGSLWLGPVDHEKTFFSFFIESGEMRKELHDEVHHLKNYLLLNFNQVDIVLL